MSNTYISSCSYYELGCDFCDLFIPISVLPQSNEIIEPYAVFSAVLTTSDYYYDSSRLLLLRIFHL